MALVPIFIDGFYEYIIHTTSMIIPRANSIFRVLGPRPLSLWLFKKKKKKKEKKKEKKFVIDLVPTFTNRF